MNNLRKLLVFFRPYTWPSLIALTFLTIQIVFDLAIPHLVQRIIDEGIGQNDMAMVVHLSLIMLALAGAGIFTAIGNNIYSVKVGECVARDLREALFMKIQSLSYGNLDRQNTGQLMVRLQSDTRAVQRLVQVSLRIGTRAPLLLLGSLVLMYHTSPSLAMALLPLLIITSLIIVFFISRTEPLFQAVQAKMDRLNSVLQENIAGARLVKAFVRADHEGERFETANEAFTKGSIRVMLFMAGMSPVLLLCVDLGMVLVVWAGGVKAIHGGLTVGQIVACTNYLLTTMVPLTMMALLSNAWAAGIVSAGRLNEVFETVPEVLDAPDAAALPDGSPCRIVFDGVGFHYAGNRDEPVLEGIDLVIEPGETVAFLGATGAGKSTLVNLVPRFYDVTAGRLLLDGRDVRTLTQDSLLSHIAIVPQETILFTGTIRDNLRYGAPDASDADVEAAARAAQAHDFIMRQADGYDTHVAERGASLSGGQKQRLAIARALLTSPTVLILDDSTSAIDVDTETRIQDALAAWPRRHTSLVVAQRISTVLRADKIVVVDRGRLAAVGTHHQLMQTSGIYQEIYASQLGNGPSQAMLDADPNADPLAAMTSAPRLASAIGGASAPYIAQVPDSSDTDTPPQREGRP